MRKPVCSDISIIEMITSNQNQDSSSESRIERMRKFLSSPLTKKKPSGSQFKIFGTSLDVLIQRAPNEITVPFIVTRICRFIEKTGLIQEGLFRISGNARLIERLRNYFDQTGDAPLETEGDVPSAAALLKLFLRELPDPIIPLSVHQQFLNAVKGNDKAESIKQLVQLTHRLPTTNFNVLKYLSFFLLQVSKYEEHNRMSASSLGIVFGPNLFRVTEDFVGLKEQSLTNQIVTYFITDYYTIFHDEPKIYEQEEFSTIKTSVKCKKSTSKVSMVSSWPKASTFPSSMISTLSLQPLSLSIPQIDVSCFPVSSYTHTANEEERVLMINSYTEGNLNLIQDTVDNGKEENKGISSARRKRKERKLITEDILESYSNFGHSSSQLNDDKLLVAVDADLDERSDHMNDDVNENTFERPTYTNEKLSDILESTGLSPHPPNPKKRGVESTSSEPVLDPQNSFNSSFTAVKDFRGTQHSAARYAVPEKVTEHHNYNQEIRGFKSMKPSLACADYTANENGDSDSVKENRESTSSSVEVDQYSEMPTNSSSEEKKSEYNAKYFHRSHRHRSYYYKKQISESESKKSDESSFESSFDHPEIKTEEETEKPLVDVAYPRNLTSDHDSVNITESVCNADMNGGLKSDQRYSWPVLRCLQDDASISLSPLPQLLKISNSSEAPLSPSAYRSYLSHRNLHLDPNMPPSPPVEQEDIVTRTKDDVCKITVKQFSRRIHTLKKKIKQYEEKFETLHGYRPSLAEKNQNSEIKKLLVELNHTRQSLKQLKEEPHMLDDSPSKSWPSLNEEMVSSHKLSKGTNTLHHSLYFGPNFKEIDTSTLKESITEASSYLEEKRNSSQRPEVLEDMTRDQVDEEKLLIQKLLLKFESVYGRPSTKTHRDLMRPLYDRYRNAKRIIARSTSFSNASKVKDATELQPILEHVAMDFKSLGDRTFSQGSVEEKDIQCNSEAELICEETPGISDLHAESEESVEPEESVPYEEVTETEENISFFSDQSNLHELSLPELFEQQQLARAEKHRLRKILREFENEFQKETGRKVQRDDKIAMESVYGEYKNVRARLKLLEALAAKRGQK